MIVSQGIFERIPQLHTFHVNGLGLLKGCALDVESFLPELSQLRRSDAVIWCSSIVGIVCLESLFVEINSYGITREKND